MGPSKSRYKYAASRSDQVSCGFSCFKVQIKIDCIFIHPLDKIILDTALSKSFKCSSDLIFLFINKEQRKWNKVECVNVMLLIF